MTKTDLVKAIAGRTRLTKVEAERAVEVLVDTIVDTLKGGGKVTLVGLGTLHVAERASRTGRNPRTGKTIEIPAAKIPKLRPAKSLKEALNKPKS